MRVALDLKDFVKYPFLKESQQFIGSYSDSIEEFIQTNPGKIALRYALGRVRDALGDQKNRENESLSPGSDSFGVKLAVASYAIARILVSCQNDRSLIERLTRFEAQRAYSFLIDEEEAKKEYVAGSVGIDIRSPEIPLIRYVETVSGLRDDRWRLINREVRAGMVAVTSEEMDELVREQIRVLLTRQLPLRVPDRICHLLGPVLEQITVAYQKQMLEQFGTVEEDSFPPCIQAILMALTSGTNITHAGRFAVTAFLHNIGMDNNKIIELYCRAPDFDISKTMYQVEHISGRGGTEYTSPSCAAMRTNGLCVKRDALCEKIGHPLSYYKLKKRRGKPGSS